MVLMPEQTALPVLNFFGQARYYVLNIAELPDYLVDITINICSRLWNKACLALLGLGRLPARQRTQPLGGAGHGFTLGGCPRIQPVDV
jgi:hypothetical protein